VQSSLRIHVQPIGGLANRMFQQMMAIVLQRQFADSFITGNATPETPLFQTDVGEPDLGRALKISSHNVDLLGVRKRIEKGEWDTILIKSPSLDVRHYAHMRNEFAGLFGLEKSPLQINSDEIVVHVRLNKMQFYSGDALTVHKDYPPLPLRFIEKVLADNNLSPIFVGEFGNDPISLRLRQKYSNCRFIRSPNAIDDFISLFSAPRALISPSSFSWLATWISPTTKKIYQPLLGLMNPDQRPDVNLVAEDDRYEYFSFPVWRWSATANDVDRAVNEDLGSKWTRG